MIRCTTDRLAHTVWECKYHLVWKPKCRRRVVYGRLRLEIGRILRRLCDFKTIRIIEAKACSDHIHMCVSIPPKYSLSQIAGYLKGKSAIILFERFSRLRHNFRGHKFWAPGYYVSTVGLDEKKVRWYIQNQQDTDRLEQEKEPTDRDPFEGLK